MLKIGRRIWGAAIGLALGIAASLTGWAGEPAAPLPKDYWVRPLAAQGKAPRSWTDIEASLAPQSCGICHADKLAEWQSSLHAKAFSPGLVGQLLTYSDEDVLSCLECHAPLAEQAADFAAARRAGKGHSAQNQKLAAAGNSCGGCHVRGHRKFGPPQRDIGAVGAGAPEAPLGGVFRSPEFSRSEFCASCHQFPADQAINGKPLENTVEEWRASPQAATGQTCQSCHMPDRRHLWRGIHDPDMVRSGLTVDVGVDAAGLRFSVANTGVGHAFPTYVTPRVVLRAALLDDGGRPISGAEASRVIQRVVKFDGTDWRELSDSRLMPGQKASVELTWGKAERARVWLEVDPDHFYRTETYPQLLKELPAKDVPARLIVEAVRLAEANRYKLFERELTRP